MSETPKSREVTLAKGIAGAIKRAVIQPINEKIANLARRQESSEMIIANLSRRVSELERRN